MIDTKNWFQLRPMYSYIKKQAENEKFLKYLEISGTFTLVAILLFFAIMPTMTAIFSLIGEIKSKETFIEKVNFKIANIIKAQDAYSQVQEKYYLIEDSFPFLAQYYNGTSNLATILRDSSLNINQISLNLNEDPTKGSQPIKSYQIDIGGEGQYSSIIEMLKKTLNNRRMIDIKDIQFRQANSDETNQTGSNNIKINFSSDLYFLPTSNEQK